MSGERIRECPRHKLPAVQLNDIWQCSKCIEETDKIREDEPEMNIKIYGWDLYRIFRDEEKEIIKIVLQKDNEFREFVRPDLYMG